MDTIKKMYAIGLMSDTSLDGIEASIIETDGIDVFDFVHNVSVPYDDNLRNTLSQLANKSPKECPGLFTQTENDLTVAHAIAVKQLVKEFDQKIDIVGFYSHTLKIDPYQRTVYQIGNPQLLADLCQIKVVANFAKSDILNGGMGAPLVPVFYNALTFEMQKPVCIINIGGITNISWMGTNGELMSFDCGPGNASINDWVAHKANLRMDYNGKLAISGKVDEQILNVLMRHKFLQKQPPKILDRNHFDDKLQHLESLSLEDGAATVTMFVAKSIANAVENFLPEKPREIIICGGGANNVTLMRFIKSALPQFEIKSANQIGWNSNSIKAQAVAYLAARRMYFLPSGFPGTTAVEQPAVCGQIYEPFIKA